MKATACHVLATLLISCLSIQIAAAAPQITEVRFHPDAPIDIRPDRPSMNKAWPKRNYPDHIGMTNKRKYYYVEPTLWANRKVYWADDEVAQFFALFPNLESIAPGERLIIRIKDRTGSSVARLQTPAKHTRVSFLLPLKELKPGSYTAQVNWTPANTLKPTWLIRCKFEISDNKNESVTIPADGIPILLEKQDVLADGRWPIVTGVPLPRGAVYDASELVLYEDGKPIPADVYAQSRWAPGSASSIQWVHVHFQGKYTGGKPSQYQLRRASTLPRSNLKVAQTDDDITVDTGYVRFVVSRKEFNGIAKAWYDPTGKGNYNDKPVIVGENTDGAYLVDQNNARYNAAADPNVKVTIELDGVAQVTVVAEGWYVNPSSPSDKLCKFVTRFTAYPDQPMIRVSQNTYITYDTWKRQLADLGFTVPVADASSYEMGYDKDQSATGPLTDEPVYLHQERWDAARLVLGNNKVEKARQSDGWFRVDRTNGPNVSVVLRDIWQKFPKEVGMSRSGLSVHFWPKHGRNVFSESEQMDFANLYKFLCFHHSRLMDLKMPTNYVERFTKYYEDQKSYKEGSHKWWRPSEHDATRDGRATGTVIGNEFAIHFSAPATDDVTTKTVRDFARAFHHDPSALATPKWNASTGALGVMAEADFDHYPTMEEALVEGWLGWGEGMVKRYKDYGMFNYADTHSVHLVTEKRPGLHRIWQASHYHNMGTNWILYYRTGDPRLLRWARKNVDHYMNIDMTNYVDAENPVPVRDHVLGAMQHIGWKTHWASSGEAWGQYKDVYGHFIDGDSLIWTWYLSGNPRAIENYRNWSTSLKKLLLGRYRGTAREVNTSFANIVTLYEATWDAELIPLIYENALSLSATPLEKQRPGPIWHPLWINRYHDLTRDPAYEPFITHYADYFKQGVESTWTGALAAKAYDLTGDRKFLEYHFRRTRDWPRTFFKRPGYPYHWFGNGDGPLGGNYIYMTWGNYLKRLQQAGYKGVPPIDKNQPLVGAYPFSSSRYNYPMHEPSVLVYALAKNGEPVTVQMQLRSLGGSLHAVHAWLHDPKGNVVWEVKRVGTGDDKNEPRTASGRPGLWRLEYHSHEARVPSPQTNLPHEAQVLNPDTRYRTSNMHAYIQPLKRGETVRLILTSQRDNKPTNIRVYDADGNRLMENHLMRGRPGQKQMVVNLNPRTTPTPWRIDTIGMIGIQIEKGGKLLLAADAESLQAIASAIARYKPTRNE